MLEQLTFLLAAGSAYKSTSQWDIVPIIIDLDQNNGNLTRAAQQLNLYRKIHREVEESDGQSEFFKYRVRQLNEVAPQASEGFHISVNTANKNSLEETIDYGGLPVSNSGSKTKGLIDLLYSKEDLKMNLNIGFQGKPHIGTMVLGQLALTNNRGLWKEPNFNAFVNNFHKGDRVFVISSIFGGTGAAGFPWLLKTLRSEAVSTVNSAFKTAPIGALVMMPYFTIQQNSNSPITSNAFITKTKAALKFYNSNLREANAFYYMADDPTNSNTGFPNNPGGAQQNNPPHIAELFGATALFHYLNLSNAELPMPTSANGPKAYRYGLGIGPGEHHVQLRHFERGRPSRRWIAAPLTRFYYTSILIRKILEHAGDNSWARDSDIVIVSKNWFKRNIDQGFFNREFYTNLKQFMDAFTQWLQAYERPNPNCLVFNPFVSDPAVMGTKQHLDSPGADTMNELIKGDAPVGAGKGVVEKTGRTSAGHGLYTIRGNDLGFWELIRRMNNLVAEVKTLKGKTDEQSRAIRLLELTYRTSQRFLNDYKHLETTAP